MSAVTPVMLFLLMWMFVMSHGVLMSASNGVSHVSAAWWHIDGLPSSVPSTRLCAT
jgi:hypothetical protein